VTRGGFSLPTPRSDWPKYDKTATRWLGRLALESKDVRSPISSWPPRRSRCYRADPTRPDGSWRWARGTSQTGSTCTWSVRFAHTASFGLTRRRHRL